MFDELCGVCRSKFSREIDDGLQEGRPHDALACQFAIDESDIFRHIEHRLNEAARPEADSEPETLLSCLRRNAARLELKIAKAQAEEDLAAFARCSSELTKNLMAQHEIANRPDTESPFTETAQIRATARKMASALSDTPEMKDAILKALRERFGDDDEYANDL